MMMSGPTVLSVTSDTAGGVQTVAPRSIVAPRIIPRRVWYRYLDTRQICPNMSTATVSFTPEQQLTGKIPKAHCYGSWRSFGAASSSAIQSNSTLALRRCGWLQVPLELRAMWRQRLRWLKGGQLFILSPGSVFFKKQEHMSFYQKALYWLCPVAHFTQVPIYFF